MVITCEKCHTRFRVDEQQIPSAGVRVRCSQCQHRFFIEPSSLPVPSDEPALALAEDSPPAGVGIAPGPDDIDFDNPEFLYDPEEEEGSLADDSDAPETKSDRVVQAESGVAFELDVGAGSGPRIEVGSQGQDLAESDDSELGLEYDLEIPGFEGPDPAPDVAEAPSDGYSLDPLLEPPTPEAARDPGRLADDEPPAALAGPELAEVVTTKPVLDVSENDLLGWEQDLAEFDEKPEPGSQAHAAGEVVATSAKAGSFEVARARRPGSRGWLAGSLARTRPALAVAFALGLALAGIGGWRAVTFGSGPLPGPALVESHGWVASGFEVFHWRSPLGARFLVIRGDLYAVGPQAVPGVRVTLVGSEGKAVAEPVWARLERPRNLEPLQGAGSASPGTREYSRENSPSWAATGFSLWIPDPPKTARRFRLDLVPAP